MQMRKQSKFVGIIDFFVLFLNIVLKDIQITKVHSFIYNKYNIDRKLLQQL